jgi:SLOG in TRPM, prokaryote
MSSLLTVHFPNQQSAAIAQPQTLAEMNAAIAEMNLNCDRPVLVLIGGAKNLSAADDEILQQLFETVLAPIAQQWQAAIVDGGTDAGIMKLIGQARQQIQGTFPLIGVAPIERVTLPGQTATSEETTFLEPNHSYFLLVPGTNWGDESRWLAEAAKTIAQSSNSVAILINGGEVTWRDALENIAVQRPMIVIAGSGRTADLIVAGLRGEPTDDRALPLIESGLVQSIDLTEREQLKMAIESIFTGV